MTTKLKPLDAVRRADNPRHTGWVRSVFPDGRARVVWNNGWIEDVDANEIMRSFNGGDHD